MPSNGIDVRQNKPEQIKVLRAVRAAYDDAKSLLAVQVLLLVVMPVIGSLVALGDPAFKGLVATLSILALILDVAVLERLQREWLRRGANLQESFDCAVLEMPWNTFTVGKKVCHEDVHEYASKLGSAKNDEHLKNWYPDVASMVPMYIGRLICQRTNLRYDARLRKRVGGSALGIGLSLAAVFILYGVAAGLTMNDWVLQIIVPCAPIFSWSMKEYFRQKDSAAALDRVRAAAEDLWTGALNGSVDEGRCLDNSRTFQNAIYERRSISPPVFNWVYNWHRGALEEQMNYSAEEMVKEAKKALKLRS